MMYVLLVNENVANNGMEHSLVDRDLRIYAFFA